MAKMFIILLLSTTLVTGTATKLDILLIKKPSLFKPCETNICFVFRSQKPIISLDPSMRTSQQQILFKCRDRAATFPRLRGPFFDLIDEVPELRNSHCIWAGSNATLNGIVRLVQKVSRGTRPLQFVAGGMLFQMPHRISNGSIPSASIINGKIVVVSANRHARRAFSDAMESIIGPFGNGAWWLLLGFIILFVVVYTLINFCFVTDKNLKTMSCAMLEPFVPSHWFLGNVIDELVHDKNSSKSRSFLIRVWKQSAILFFVVSAIFYEIGVVNFVTNDKPYVLPFLLRGMRQNTLERFVVNKGSAFETILSNLASPEELVKNPFPWERVKTFDDVFDTLSDTKNGQTRYSISSDHTALYELNNRGLCAKLAVHDTSQPLPDFSSVFYYSNHVDLNMRTALDIRISRLRDQGHVQKMVEASVGKVTLTCGLSANSISIFVLLVPLGIVLCPFFCFILSALLVRWILQRQERMKLKEKLPTIDTMTMQ